MGITWQAASNSLLIAGVIADAIAWLLAPYSYVHFFQIVAHNLLFAFMEKVHLQSVLPLTTMVATG